MKNHIPRWADPAVSYKSLTIGEAARREALVKSLKARRDSGLLDRDVYADLASLYLG